MKEITDGQRALSIQEQHGEGKSDMTATVLYGQAEKMPTGEARLREELDVAKESGKFSHDAFV